MPEGDTIFRTARTLQAALGGRIVIAFNSVYPALNRIDHVTPLTGRTVTYVRAMGKHLLMGFTRGLVLRTHMRMHGSWHIYRLDEQWQRPRQEMRIMVATCDFIAVAFNVHVAEFIDEALLDRHEELRRLGPDLLSDTFDPAEAVRRLRSRGGREVADALLAQHLVAGIGNVYKSEVLFTCRLNPFTRVADLSDTDLEILVDTARRLLRANVAAGSMATSTGYRRTTGRDDPRERLWVYGRPGRPCRRCGTTIEGTAQGLDARLTYWCPSCQAPRPPSGSPTETS